MNDINPSPQRQAAPAPSWRFRFCTGNIEEYGTAALAARRLAALLGRAESKTPPAQFLPMPDTGGGVRRFGNLLDVELVQGGRQHTIIMTAATLTAEGDK